MGRWLRMPGATAAAVGALLLAGCGGSAETDTESAAAQAYVAGDGSVVSLQDDERPPAPPLAAESLDGRPVSLQDWRGKVIVLNVWASWCAPCRAEAAGLAEVFADTRRTDVAFLGLATRDSEATASAFADRFGLDYPHVLDVDGSLQLLFRDTLPPQAIPSTIVIDRSGRVAGRVLGEVSPATLRGLIEPLVEERAA
jgi:peroxiredoxin